MARVKSPHDQPADHDPEKPNHMILWLDLGIGEPKEYIHLKKAFGSNTDPRTERPMMLNDRDYEKILLIGDAVTVTFEGVTFLLQAFQREEDCLKAFKDNQDKRIFFITSGSLGKEAVPKIISQYGHVFTDPITNQPYPSIYVFCANIPLHMKWAGDYIEYVQMFNFDSELLERMTRDIASYFIVLVQLLRIDNNLDEALKHLHWAKKLWYQYDKMIQRIGIDDLRVVVESQQAKEINVIVEELYQLCYPNQHVIWSGEVSHSQGNNDNRNSSDEDEDDTKVAQSSS